MFLVLRQKFIKILAYYIAYFRQPWTQAMVFAGWAEYQEFGAYKERVAAIDCAYAINQFFDGSEWKYYFQKRVAREPMLYWKMVLFPWGLRFLRCFRSPPIQDFLNQNNTRARVFIFLRVVDTRFYSVINGLANFEIRKAVMSDTRNALDTIYNVVMEAFEAHIRITFCEAGKFQANAMSFDAILRDLEKSVSITLQTAWIPNEEAKSHIAKIQGNLEKVLSDWLVNATALKNRGAALNPASTHVYEMLRKDLENAFRVI